MSQPPISQTANTADIIPGLIQPELSPPTTARQIVTRVGKQRLVFQNEWVAEVVLLKQNQILSLPFYDAALLGVVPYQGGVMPVLATQSILSVVHSPQQALSETLTVIRLSEAVPGLAGVGLLVDQLLGQQATLDHAWIWFDPNMIATQRWQPQR